MSSPLSPAAKRRDDSMSLKNTSKNLTVTEKLQKTITAITPKVKFQNYTDASQYCNEKVSFV